MAGLEGIHPNYVPPQFKACVQEGVKVKQGNPETPDTVVISQKGPGNIISDVSASYKSIKARFLFAQGQLYLMLASSGKDRTKNLEKAKEVFSDPQLASDPYLKAASLLRLVEIDMQQAEYYELYYDTEFLDFAIKMTDQADKIQKVATKAQASIDSLNKTGYDARELKIRLDFDKTILELSKPYIRIRTKPETLDPLIEQVKSLPEPLGKMLEFELKLKKASLYIERAQRGNKHTNLDKAFILLQELEVEYPEIESYGQIVARDTSNLKAEIYYLLAVYFTGKRNQDSAIEYARKAYQACTESSVPYTHSLLIVLIKRNTNISRKKAGIPYWFSKNNLPRFDESRAEKIWIELINNGYVIKEENKDTYIINPNKKLKLKELKLALENLNLNNLEIQYIFDMLKIASY